MSSGHSKALARACGEWIPRLDSMSGWTEAMRAGDFARAWTITDRDLAAADFLP